MNLNFKGILLVAAIVGFVIGAGIGSGSTYLICKGSFQTQISQARAQAQTAQAYRDSLRYAGQLAGKDLIIADKIDENLLLRSRIQSDSIRYLSKLESIRAINNYIRTGKK